MLGPHLHVRDIRGNRRKRRSQHAWKAEQWNVIVEMRHRAVSRNFVHVFEIVRNLSEVAERIKNHASATFLEETRVTNKLDRIAETLLGMQHDSFAAEILAIPHWSPYFPPHGCKRLSHPAEFQLIPSLAQATGFKKEHRS